MDRNDSADANIMSPKSTTEHMMAKNTDLKGKSTGLRSQKTLTKNRKTDKYSQEVNVNIFKNMVIRRSDTKKSIQRNSMSPQA